MVLVRSRCRANTLAFVPGVLARCHLSSVICHSSSRRDKNADMPGLVLILIA